MKKILPVAIAVFFVLGAVLYTGIWALQAWQLKRYVEQGIAEINSKEKLLTYESLQMGGFPREARISIVQPRFTGRIDTLLKSLPRPAQENAQQIAWNNAISHLPEWKEDIALAGHYTFGVDVFSSSFLFESDGPMTISSTINGQNMTLVQTPGGVSRCIVKLKRDSLFSGLLWDASRLKQPAELLIKDFRLLDCNVPSVKTTETATNEVIASLDSLGFTASYAPDGGGTVHIAGKMQNMEGKPRYEAFLNRYFSLFASVPGMPVNSNIAALGKQNLDVDMTFRNFGNGMAHSTDTPYQIEIPRMNFTNALFTHNGSFSLANTPTGTEVATVFKLYSESIFTPQYDVSQRAYMLNFIRNLKLGTEPQFASMRKMLEPYTAEQVLALITPALPKFSTLSPLVLRSEGTYTRPVSHPEQGELTLKDLTISASPYALGMSGKASASSPQTAQVAVACRNCLVLVDDVASYLMRLREAISRFDPEAAKPLETITAQLAIGVKGFLGALAERSTDEQTRMETFTFRFIGAPMGFTLNGKSPDQIIPLFQQYIAPYLPQPAPPPQSPGMGSSPTSGTSGTSSPS